MVADFCAAAVLISLGAVLGKTSLVQLVIMAAFEVVIQSVNEHIGVEYLKAVDIGESIYVHVFGAYFGLAVAKVLNNKKVENSRESSVYHSDLFSMIGEHNSQLDHSSSKPGFIFTHFYFRNAFPLALLGKVLI